MVHNCKCFEEEFLFAGRIYRVRVVLVLSVCQILDLHFCDVLVCKETKLSMVLGWK